MPERVDLLVTDAGQFATFARQLRAKLATDFSDDAQFVLAMLDALDDQWSAAVARLDRIAAHQDDPKTRAMRGLTIRVWANSVAAGSFKAALGAKVDALPHPLVDADLGELRAMAHVFTPETCRGLIRDHVMPQVEHGRVTLPLAQAIVFQRYVVVRLVPVAKDIESVLEARGIALPTE